MSVEQEKNDWTVNTLKEYLEAVIDGNDQRYQQRFDAQEAASKYSQEKSNEFRGSLDDIGKKQMPRTEAESLVKALQEQSAVVTRTNSEKMDALQARMDQFVKAEVYLPAHEELRRQRVIDAEKLTVLTGDVKNNATEIAGMKSSLTWLTRLIIGALILAIIAWVFQRIGH